MSAPEIAKKMETDAVAFYTEAAGRTSHPVGKKIFLSIAEDEKRHIRMVDAILKGMGYADADNIDPMDNIKTVFSENKAAMSQRIAATTDDKEAFKIAMEMEKKGYEFYQQSAASATDAKVKALFTRLATEEQKHHKVFSDTYAFLNDTGNWYMWEEQGIVEG